MARNADLNAVARQWELLKLLPTKPPGLTSREIQNKLHNLGYGVTKRTVERDLQDLTGPFPILCNDKGKPYGWYWTPGANAGLPGITVAEALSIRLIEDLLKPLLPPAILDSLQAHFSQAQAKLRTLQQDNAAARWQNKIRHVSPALPMLPPSIDATVLDTVQQALLYDRQIEVEYQAVHAGMAKKRTLHPLGLVQRGPVTYLVATAFNYQDIRLYALHRILSATTNEQPANRCADFDLDRYIDSGALQFGEDTIRLKAWVSEDLADYLRETRLSEDQILVAEDDGYLLTSTVSDSWQLRWWVLSQGDSISIHEPVYLRETIIRTLSNSLKKYEINSNCKNSQLNI